MGNGYVMGALRLRVKRVVTKKTEEGDNDG